MVPGGGTGGRKLTGGGVIRGGGGGSPGGGGASTTGRGWPGKGRMLGRLTSSTTTGSLPWSNGHMSPRMQKPFSGEGKTDTPGTLATLQEPIMERKDVQVKLHKKAPGDDKLHQ